MLDDLVYKLFNKTAFWAISRRQRQEVLHSSKNTIYYLQKNF